ncbi:Peptidyl-prolyl cis-trans isomerase CYP65 [Hibiscus syriacus]|uniref:Peptidyl-prolyl cis-trans isomerase CYP65 n=1 Tax=Hibiscus syriacus TaxID=106335 RepID=A0A6A3ALE4_HIBSY|nr:Peptidyl-prolyl cis-trans isomerase CYP65 [Hibiscus syriacus]
MKVVKGEYHCPVLNKVFTEYTHSCCEDYRKCNPNALDSKVTLDFDHVKNSLKVDDEELRKMSSDPTYNINVAGDIKQMLAELGTDKAKQLLYLEADANGESKSQPVFSIVDAASASVHGRSAAAAKSASSDKTAARIAMHMAGERAPVNAKMVKSRFTTGAASRSFTSTNYDPVTKNEFETCENFITLVNVAITMVWLSIETFGGDPTGTGRGGESIWGKPFNDELNSKLLHSGRGVVSMANSGPHTNGSQFFILYKSANHLNFKHTVFGGVVGGLTSLSAMEKVPVDDNDKPLEEIKIISVTVFVNPYSEPDEEEEEEQEKSNGEKAAEDEDNDKIGSWYSNPGTGMTEAGAVGGGGVGKYLKAWNSHSESAAVDTNITAISVTKKRKTARGEFKDFSAW